MVTCAVLAVVMLASAGAASAEPDAGVAAPPLAPISASESKREFGLVSSLAPGTVRAPLAGVVLTEGGVHPMSLLGVALDSRLGGERWSVLVGAWTLFPTTLIVSDLSSVNAFSFGGTLGACAQFPLLAGLVVGCVAGRAGALFTWARYATLTSPGWQPMASAGLRLAVEWPRDTTFALTVALHAWVPVVRPAVTTDSSSWAQPWVHGGGSIGLIVRPW